MGGYDGRQLFAAADAAAAAGPGGRLARLAQAVPGNDVRALTAMIGGMASDPTPPPAAEHLRSPALVVVGARDELAHNAFAWASRMPAGRALSIAGRDHVSTIPSAAFRSAAVDFFRA